MFKRAKNKKGFTLIELIVVVAILAILAAIAVPAFAGVSDRAEQGVEIANAKMIAQAINLHNTLYPTNQVSAVADAQTTVGDLWPSDLPADLTGALGRITITDGVAAVDATIE